MEEEVEGIHFDNLLAVRESLRATLEKSSLLSKKVDETGLRLEKIGGNLELLSTALSSTYSRKCTLSAVRIHVDRAFGPVSAVLRIYDSVHGLEGPIVAGPKCGGIMEYLGLVKQIEEALRFLSDNCGLAVQWIEDVEKLLDENVDTDDHYVIKVKKLLRILKELKALETRARLNGGLLSDSSDKLELEFRKKVQDYCQGYAFGEFSELQAIVERLNANGRMENCMTIYSNTRGSSSRAELQALNLSYLEGEITELDSVQKFEDHLVKWGKHLEFALKNVLQVEYDLCKAIFDKFGSDIPQSLFSRITKKSGFLGLLEFGNNITEAKKDAIKLLKLLNMFGVLDKLRIDFNTLFSSKSCLEIQNLTRDLVKRVVNGACEIFMELRVQVEFQRCNTISPPLDGSVPRLVTFVTNFCIMLLEDEYRPALSQVLSIHKNWTREKSPNGFLRKEFQKICEAMEVNLEMWSKSFEDPALSCFFLMNNYTFLSQFLQETVFGNLMGENWLSKYHHKTENYTSSYLQDSWGKLPIILSEEGLILFSPGRSTTQELVKKRVREFNEVFEEIYRKQSEWVLSDDGLRMKACQVIVQTVVPSYRFFLHNYGYLVQNGGSPGKYVKYSVANLEVMISSLFQPKIARFGRNNSTKSSQLMGKLRNAVSNPFRVAPIST